MSVYVWIQGGSSFSTGNREHGAVIWPWTMSGYRIQCWTTPRDRIVTFRRSRPLDEAKRVAEKWLAARSPSKTGRPGR